MLFGGDLVVAASQVLHEGEDSEAARRFFQRARNATGVAPMEMAASIRSPVMVLIPRIGRSRRFSCAWSASMRLLAYRSV